MSVTGNQLADVLRPVKHVLLDFDGPVCSIFDGFPAREVACGLARAVAGADEEVPTDWAAETDPLALLRHIADVRPDLTATADEALGALEEKAVASARPTRGAETVLSACADSGRSVWVVSNNSGSAITAYLAAHDLTGLVAGVFGRREADPASMKPNPCLLLDAMTAAGATPAECVFIGDAVRDVEAGHAAGVPTIGYANKPGKAERLAAAGAVLVVDTLNAITAALRGGTG